MKNEHWSSLINKIIFIYSIKNDEPTEVNFGCSLLIKLKHNRTVNIHSFKSYNIITNVHDFGQIISTFVNICEGLKCDFVYVVYFFW